MYSKGSIPIEFIDSLEEKQHLMLFYEDPEYARLLEFWFLKRGLERGETCIYATDEDSGSVVLGLQRYGISLDDFLLKKVQVFYIRPFSGTTEEILLECRKEVSKILLEVKRPFRIVSRIVSDVATIQGISAELEMEKITHDCFDDLGGTIMCPYDVSKIEKSKRLKWVQALYSYHHAVIYIPKIGEGGVICPISPSSRMDLE